MNKTIRIMDWLSRCGGTLLAAASIFCGSSVAADAIDGIPDVDTVVVTADRPRAEDRVTLFGAAADAATLPVSTSVVTAARLRERQPDRIEEALLQTGTVLPSVSSAGLSTSLNARGFDLASRIQYNGHADLQRMYVRDLATVERIEVLKGPTWPRSASAASACGAWKPTWTRGRVPVPN